MALQSFATSRIRPPAGATSRRIRNLASRLPEMYAAKDAAEAQKEDLRLKTETLAQQKLSDQRTFGLSKKQFSAQKETDARTTGLAVGTLGLQGGMAAMKLNADPDMGRTSQSDGGYGWGEVGIGGISGGMAGGGIARGVGAEKKWQTSLAGAAGGAAMTYLAGGTTAMEVGGGALLGGAIGAFF